jgi:hypothetical protein
MGNAVQVVGPLGTSIRGPKRPRRETRRRKLEPLRGGATLARGSRLGAGDGQGETIWRHPEDGKWYEQERAVQLLKGGEDVGSSD